MAEVTEINNGDDIYTKKVKAAPVPEKNIGIDTNNTFQTDIANAILSSEIDISEVDKFTSASQNRDILYAQIDNMCVDGMISAVLEDYAQDSTEYNQSGHVMWAESNDPDIAKYINFLLENFNVDKNAFRWAYCLCKYGDVYLRLVHKSEYDRDIFSSKEQEESKVLQEGAKLVTYSNKDQYALYVEMQPNPAEIFELTQFDKTSGYIRTHVNSSNYSQTIDASGWYDPTRTIGQYKFNIDKDVEMYAATEFVHGCLETGMTRYQEKVNLFTLNDDGEESQDYSYTVKRGQSVLYDIYKTWRALSLLESSILLARLTQSALTRVITVNTQNTAREEIPIQLNRVKQLLEQKSAFDTNKSFLEYTNPGPIINNIYVPSSDGNPVISSSVIGGDFDPKQLTDLEYFRDKLFGQLRVPKQLYGYTGDSAGFDAGKSIAEMSAKYAKFLKRIQNVLCQMVTDLLNIILLSKGLDSYINKFQLKMTTPASTEEQTRADIFESRISKVRDIVDVINLDDDVARLKVLKSLLFNVVENQEVIDIIQDVIEKLEAEGEKGIDEENEFGEEDFGMGGGGFREPPTPEGEDSIEDFMGTSEAESEPLPTPEEIGAEEGFFDYNDGELLQEKEADNTLPSGAELGVDLLNMGA